MDNDKRIDNNADENIDDTVEDNGIDSSIDNDDIDNNDVGNVGYNNYNYGGPVGYMPHRFGNAGVPSNLKRHNFNPVNRPTESNDDSNNDSNKSDDKKDNEKSDGIADKAAKGAVNTGGKAAAGAVGGALGSKVYDVASKTKIGQSIENVISRGIKKKVIIGIAVGAAILILLLIIFLGASSIVMKIFDKDKDSEISDIGFSSIGDDSGFWWPVGSNETTTKNGKTFASGTPALTIISSPFSSYRALTGRAHYGFDIGSGGKIGVYNLIAIKSGTVIKVNNTCDDNGFLHNKCGGELGNYITIDHGNGYYSRYQHMARDSVTVSVGDKVEQGQVIGKIGKSGSCTGAHLHFQIHVGGTSNTNAVDPAKYVSASNPRPVATSSAKFMQGGNVQQSVCLTLRNAGFDNNAVAAIMGNMYHESRFNTSAKNYLGCLGLVQWCFGRKNNLVATYGNNWTSVDNQLELLIKELNQGYYKSTKNYLMASHSAGDKGYFYCNHFEVPGESECRKRISTSEGYTSYVKNGCK